MVMDLDFWVFLCRCEDGKPANQGIHITVKLPFVPFVPSCLPFEIVTFEHIYIPNVASINEMLLDGDEYPRIGLTNVPMTLKHVVIPAGSRVFILIWDENSRGA